MSATQVTSLIATLRAAIDHRRAEIASGRYSAVGVIACERLIHRFEDRIARLEAGWSR